MHVRLVYSHIGHHATHSGCDQLVKYVSGRPWREDWLFRLAQKVPERWRGDLPNTELLPGISDEQLRDEVPTRACPVPAATAIDREQRRTRGDELRHARCVHAHRRHA